MLVPLLSLLFLVFFIKTMSLSLFDIQRAVNAEVTTLLRSKLLSWYRRNRRQMPWRGDTTAIPITPYSIWVSEVMLQQTRVETVISYWSRWMESFPTVGDLARASPEEVNQLWAGLGYYRRAQNLLKGAKYVVDHYNGVIPSSREGLLTIPGIGPYTAGAIASIAFQQREALVDGNVLRVFSRLFALREEVGGGKMEKICWKIADELVDPCFPGDFNQALMELGATVCTPTSAKCNDCPVKSLCAVYQLVNKGHANEGSDASVNLPALLAYDIEDHPVPQSVNIFPYKKDKKKAKELSFFVMVLRNRFNSSSDWRYLMVRRPNNGLLANQWEFPSFYIQENAVKKKQGETSISEMGILDVESDIDDEVDSEDRDDALKSWVRMWQAQTNPWLIAKEAVDIKNNPVYLEFCEQLYERTGYKFSTVNESEFDMSREDETRLFLRSVHTLLITEPIVHIFSHERHTMYILVQDVEFHESNMYEGQRITEKQAWRTENDIIAAGITTGAKKVLAATKQAKHPSPKLVQKASRSDTSMVATAKDETLTSSISGSKRPQSSLSGDKIPDKTNDKSKGNKRLKSEQGKTAQVSKASINLEKFLHKPSSIPIQNLEPVCVVEIVDLVD